MIPNPVQLQTEKTIWSDSMLEAPDGAFALDVLFLEKQKKGEKCDLSEVNHCLKTFEKGQWLLSLSLCFCAGLGDLET